MGFAVTDGGWERLRVRCRARLKAVLTHSRGVQQPDSFQDLRNLRNAKMSWFMTHSLHRSFQIGLGSLVPLLPGLVNAYAMRPYVGGVGQNMTVHAASYVSNATALINGVTYYVRVVGRVKGLPANFRTGTAWSRNSDDS